MKVSAYSSLLAAQIQGTRGRLDSPTNGAGTKVAAATPVDRPPLQRLKDISAAKQAGEERHVPLNPGAGRREAPGTATVYKRPGSYLDIRV